jgi:glycosyltransferase involved in cell wall biosynthesis
MAESMAAGVPVIAMDLGSCCEVVKHKETGYVVRTIDDAIAAVADVGSIDRRRCRLHVEENFSIARMAERYERVYEEIFRREEMKARNPKFEIRNKSKGPRSK